jgi:hypothetical protein
MPGIGLARQLLADADDANSGVTPMLWFAGWPP